MWEVLERTPLGRVSMRKFIVLLATLVVVTFGTLFAGTTVVRAAGEATWKGEAIVYNSHTYQGPVTAVDNDPSGLPKDTVYYTYRETPGKGYVIYFSPGVDPPSASKATLAAATFTNETPSSTSNPKEIPVTPDQPGPSEGTTSCAVEGIGWVVCPVSNFIAKGMDLIYGYIQGFLKVPPLATSQDQALYRAWSIMRDFANVAFVIGFLILIYGQISGGLLTNYTIKKMLPRIIVAAILVNISYWICAVAVDVSNILGAAIQDLFIGIRNSLVGKEGNSWDLVGWESFTSLVLSGGSAAAGVGIATYLGLSAASTATVGASVAGGIGGLIMLLLPMLIGLLFIVLITFLILAARQAIITIFIVISPLAFVAYLLPNTEKWFDKWRGALFTLLLLFPAFSVVFGGSQLAASIIIQNASNVNMILLAMAVQVAPLAITPLLLKLGGGVLNRFANIVNNPTKGVFDRGKNWARERSAETRAGGLKTLAQGRTLARDAGQRGIYKTDRNGELIRDRNGNPILRRRNSIHNMAYAREYTRRRREGLKAGNESAVGGYFTQTAAGRGIYNLEQDAAGEKHAGENANFAAYKTAMSTGVDPTNTRRRHIHHQAHIDKGVGDVYEEQMNNHAERDLQTMINNPAGPLRNLKIQASVDASQAKLQAASVDADAKLAFQTDVANDRNLRVMKVATFVAEQQAGSIETRLQKNAEARWNDLSKNDPNIQELRLQEVRATQQAKLTEERFNRMVADVKLNGGTANGITVNGNLANSIQSIATQTVAAEKAVAAINSTQQSNAEALFTKSSEGRRLNSAAQSAETRLKTAKAQSEVAYITSTEGRQVNAQQQAASDRLEAEKAEEAALIQEWRTEEGAQGLTGAEAVIAAELRDADTQKRVQTQRTGAAKRVSDVEYAKQISDDSTGLAVVAGGIEGDTGVSQAKSVAFQTIVEAHNKGVAAEKTPLSRIKPDELLGAQYLGSPTILDEPTEKISAIAGMIASGSHQESHINLWNRMSELQREAQDELASATASGNQAAIKTAEDKVGKVKDLQQQVMGDKKKKPFGVGDFDQGQASVGRYDGDIYESTRSRIETHLSPESLAAMDPDDMRLIFEMARAGKLNSNQLSKVKKAYDGWEANENLNSSLADKHRVMLDPIRELAQSGNNVFPVDANRYAGVDQMSNP